MNTFSNSELEVPIFETVIFDFLSLANGRNQADIRGSHFSRTSNNEAGIDSKSSWFYQNILRSLHIF